jgi:hypothetical protein
MPSESPEVVERESSPYTGKLSARLAGRPGDFLLVKESLRRSLLHHSLAADASAQHAFLRHGGIYRSDGVPNQTQNHLIPSWGAASRWSAPDAV